LRQWLFAEFVPGYSGGPVFDLHEVPFSTRKDALDKKYEHILWVPEFLPLITRKRFSCQDNGLPSA
jgi:hypothetical protein